MVKVAYRAGLEHSNMRGVPGGLRRILGPVDGLSKTVVWHRGNGHILDLSDADAKVLAEGLKSGAYATDPVLDYTTGQAIPKRTAPEFLIGDAEIKAHLDDFLKRWAAYQEYAAALAALDADQEVFA